MKGMSEMEYETPPEAYAPLVRFWFGRASNAWTRFMFPPRRSTWIFWGWLLLIPLIWITIKAYLYLAIMLVLVVLQILTGIVDVGTWYWRDKAAQRAALEPYAREVFQHPREEYPPGDTG